jgi:hypothetical protein
MPRLSSLELESWSDGLGVLLDSLIIPSLREIRLDLPRAPRQWCKNELLALIDRSSSPLKKLDIRQKDISRADITACFENIQTLHEVYVRGGRPRTYYRTTLDRDLRIRRSLSRIDDF